jgi:hypothetical protein
MKMSDIMRDIADLLDQQGDDQQGGSTKAHLTPVAAPEPEMVDDPLMVPPLQQKHELLKKVAGVDNAYDQEAGCDQQPDDLARMKKMAGIVMAGDENDIN